MHSYLLIGFGVYLGIAISRLSYFEGTNFWGVFKGVLLGVIAWPIALYAVYYMNKHERDIPDPKEIR